MFPIYTSKTWLHWQSIMTTGWQLNPQTLHRGNQIGAHQFYNQMQTGRSEMSACSTGSPGMDSSHTSTAGQLTNPAARDDRIRRKLRRGRSRGARTSDGVVVLGRSKEKAAGAADPVAEGLDSGRNPRWASWGRSWAAAGRRCQHAPHVALGCAGWFDLGKIGSSENHMTSINDSKKMRSEQGERERGYNMGFSQYQNNFQQLQLCITTWLARWQRNR
jgi:hypothetical protein